MDTKEFSGPRFIDTIARPQKVRPIKVIVLSASRTGTLSLYKGLNVLGYKPYHVVEMCAGGLDHFRMFSDFIRLSRENGGSLRPYGRPEFDKWFTGFDAICEIPSYGGGTPFVDAYIDDPDVKFILTERTPASFARSINNTVGRFCTAGHSFPMGLLKYFDTYNREFFRLGDEMYQIYAQGKMPDDPNCGEMIERWYEE